jgi:hypothetical protein
LEFVWRFVLGAWCFVTWYFLTIGRPKRADFSVRCISARTLERQQIWLTLPGGSFNFDSRSPAMFRDLNVLIGRVVRTVGEIRDDPPFF